MHMTDEDTVVDLAKQALTQPEDSWFGNDNLWVTHGMSGFSVHRDSELVEQANFLTATQLLESKFCEENVDGVWWINNANHWAVGWVKQIMVRVVIDPDSDLSYENITDIFKFSMDTIAQIQDYGLLDESTYVELKEEELIKEVDGNAPAWSNNTFDCFEIINMAYCWDLEMTDDRYSWMISPAFVEAAAFALGMFDVEDVDDVENNIESIICTDTSNNYDDVAIAKTLISEMFELINNK